MVRQEKNSRIQSALEKEMKPYSSERLLGKNAILIPQDEVSDWSDPQSQPRKMARSMNIERMQVVLSKIHGSPDEEREKDDFQILVRQVRPDVRQGASLTYNRIRLHVYDLISDNTVMPLWGVFEVPVGQIFNTLNSGLHTLGTGAYHVGLEVNGIEYAYGANAVQGVTGVFSCPPMQAPGYQFRTTIDFGDRKFCVRNGVLVNGRKIILGEMAHEYKGVDYNLLRKNCCTFVHDACLRLGIEEQEVPTWFRNLAEAGAASQDAARSIKFSDQAFSMKFPQVFPSPDRKTISLLALDGPSE